MHQVWSPPKKRFHLMKCHPCMKPLKPLSFGFCDLSKNLSTHSWCHHSSKLELVIAQRTTLMPGFGHQIHGRQPSRNPEKIFTGMSMVGGFLMPPSHKKSRDSDGFSDSDWKFNHQFRWGGGAICTAPLLIVGILCNVQNPKNFCRKMNWVCNIYKNPKKKTNFPSRKGIHFLHHCLEVILSFF